MNFTLPVIEQDWFCSSFLEADREEVFGLRRGRKIRKLLKRFPKRANVAGDPGVAASSENGLACAGLQPVGTIWLRTHLRVQALCVTQNSLEEMLETAFRTADRERRARTQPGGGEIHA